MDLYLKKADPSGRSTDEQTGEHRGGRYAARVQIGYEKDNSPRYRYFKTVDEYKKYLDNKGSSDKKGSKKGSKKDSKSKDLESTVKQEQRTSKQKQTQSSKERKESLFISKDKDKKKKDKKVSKGLYLYVRR